MRKLLLFLFLIMTYSSIGQSITSDGLFCAGGYFSNSFAQISWTLGDAQITTIKSSEVILTQGFLQSNFEITGINEFSENENIEVSVFPNPVKDILNLKFSSKDETILHSDLYSMDGKKIYQEKFNTSLQTAEIHFKTFQSGYYILKIFSEDRSFLKTYKILFQD